MDKRIEKRNLILNQAEKLFNHFGYAKVSLNDIAQKCNMGKSSLYYYFSSKEEIFEEVIRGEIQFVLDRIREAIEKKSSPQEQLSSYVLVRMKVLKERTSRYKTISEEYNEQYAFISQIREDFRDDELKLIKSILDKGIDEGLFSTINNSERTAVGIYYALKGLEEPIISCDGDVDELVDNLLLIIFNGILTKER